MLVGMEAYETVLQRTLVLTNAAVGAVFTGVARAAYEEALTYIRARACKAASGSGSGTPLRCLRRSKRAVRCRGPR